MAVLIPPLLAMLCSIFALLVLGNSNAKEYSVNPPYWPLSKVWRQLAGAAVLVPGFVLVVFGLLPSLLVWLAAITIGGWLILGVPKRLV